MQKYVIQISLLVLTLISCTGRDNRTISEPQVKSDITDITKISNTNESIYQLQGTWLNQNKKEIELKYFKGKVVVLAMIFTHCQYACPKIVSEIKSIESTVSNDKDVAFVLVSFDSERDTASQLKIFYDQMKLNPKWTLLRGSEQLTRELSVLLNVNYEKQENGSFSHSNTITIIDKSGCIKFQKEGLDNSLDDCTRYVKSLL